MLTDTLALQLLHSLHFLFRDCYRLPSPMTPSIPTWRNTGRRMRELLWRRRRSGRRDMRARKHGIKLESADWQFKSVSYSRITLVGIGSIYCNTLDTTRQYNSPLYIPSWHSLSLSILHLSRLAATSLLNIKNIFRNLFESIMETALLSPRAFFIFPSNGKFQNKIKRKFDKCGLSKFVFYLIRDEVTLATNM